MKKFEYCLLAGMDEHSCRNCDNCYCKLVGDNGQEPTDAEIEEEIDRQMAEAEAMADSL